MAKKIKPEIKESLSGTFLVKRGNTVVGGFRERNHAEIFLKVLSEQGRFYSDSEIDNIRGECFQAGINAH